jgi:DNA polymerase-3 subunit delta'
LCQQIAQGIFRDLVFFDGQFEKIKIGPVREMRQGLAQSPEYAGRRVVVLHEAQNLTPEAANALLKSLEEPPPDNVFILTTPQREWLLPTLISRSWTLTLDWPVQDPNNPKLAQEWLPRLAFFWKNSRGLFEYSGQKSSLSPPVLNAILAVCQRELLSAMTQSEPDSELARLFKSGLAPKHLPLIDQIIHKALEAQRCQVNPALILDWFALQVWKQLKDLPSGRT